MPDAFDPLLAAHDALLRRLEQIAAHQDVVLGDLRADVPRRRALTKPDDDPTLARLDDMIATIDRLKAAGEFLSIPDLTVWVRELSARVAALEARLARLEGGETPDA